MLICFELIQDSIPDEIKNKEQIGMFSMLPENMQIEALQNNVVQTICAMECAKVAGGNFLSSVLATVFKISDQDKALDLLLEIEQEAHPDVMDGLDEVHGSN